MRRLLFSLAALLTIIAAVGYGVGKNWEKEEQAKLALQNEARSAQQLEALANQGDIEAQFELGKRYEIGEGVRQNLFKATEWYRKAGGLGHLPQAQYALGQAYFNGRGVPHDYEKAVEWFERAASQGYPTAQYMIGIANRDGWDRPVNMAEAYKWISLSLSNPDQVKADNPKYDVKKTLREMEAKMHSAQIEEGKRRAALWKPRS